MQENGEKLKKTIEDLNA